LNNHKQVAELAFSPGSFRGRLTRVSPFFSLHNKFLRWQRDYLQPIVSNIIQFNHAEKGVKI